MPDLLTVTETAAALGVTRQAVLQRIEAGTLPATKIGKSYVIQRVTLDRLTGAARAATGR